MLDSYADTRPSQSSISDRVERSLSTLARRYVTTRFVKLDHEIAEMDHIGVPAILAYKAGDVFATIVNIQPEQRDLDGLESLMKQYVDSDTGL